MSIYLWYNSSCYSLVTIVEMIEIPVIYDPKTKKYRIGKGKPIYKTKEAAERAYKGYLYAKHGKKVNSIHR
jgi:hypothetical protein